MIVSVCTSDLQATRSPRPTVVACLLAGCRHRSVGRGCFSSSSSQQSVASPPKRKNRAREGRQVKVVRIRKSEVNCGELASVENSSWNPNPGSGFGRNADHSKRDELSLFCTCFGCSLIVFLRLIISFIDSRESILISASLIFQSILFV